MIKVPFSEEVILRIEKHLTGEGRWSQMEGYRIVTTRQTIELVIDNMQSCCENWGYFWSNDNPQDFIGAFVRAIYVTDTALHAHKVPHIYEGDVMFVNIDTNQGLLQFVAYNEHNGYYGHTAKVVSTQLQHEKNL